MMAKLVLKSLKSRSYRFVVVLLLLGCLLTFNVGRLTPVYALAAPVPEVAPIFDTQIYQFSDYFNNVLSEPQHDILYFILGSWLYVQSASSQYTINDPFETEDGVINWFKSMGLKLTESILQWGIGYDPLTGTDLREELGFLVWYAMGAADYASKYVSLDELLATIDSSTEFFLPVTPQLQMGINTVLGLNGGLYDWQFTHSDIDFYPFTFTWYNPVPIGEFDFSRGLAYILENNPNGYFSTRYNVNNAYGSPENSYRSARYGTLKNYSTDVGLLPSSLHLFINLTSHSSYLVFDDGTPVNGNYIFGYNFSLSTSSGSPVLAFGTSDNSSYLMHFNTYTFSSIDVDNITQLVQNCINHNYLSSSYARYTYEYDYSYLIADAYYGVSWSDKVLITNVTDLNFADIAPSYYQQVQNDYLLDIKGLISDLVDVTNLYPILLDHLFDYDGTQVTNPAFIQVSINLPDDNPLPVNLNEIEVYTHNEYLDALKQNATAFGSVIGEFVAFWHNADWEFTYVVLGSCIIVLIGAFIGKWGHS